MSGGLPPLRAPAVGRRRVSARSGRGRTHRRLLSAPPAAGWSFLAAAWTAGSQPLHAQEPPAALPGPGDTAPVTDTVAPRRQAYPAPVELPAAGGATVYEWDLGGQLRSGAISLLDLLIDGLPGFTSVRVAYYGGPHHFLDALLGPGFVRVLVDGREVGPLRGGQVDLTRISLVRMERVRAVRRVDGWTIELTTLRHDRRDAYSRIAAGTGQPGLELLQGTFTNGLGRALTLAVAMDLLNVTSGDLPSDRFDFWGKVSWMPVDDRAGVELQYRTETLERSVPGLEDLDRREIFLHARGDLAPGLQASLFAGTEEVKTAEGSATRSRHAGLSLAAARGPGWARLGVDVRDAAFLPSVAGEASVGARPAPGLDVELAARAEAWPGFTTGGLRAGARWVPDLGIGLALSAAGGTGLRGVAFPDSAAADTLAYDAAEVAAEASVGPFRLAERVGWQDIGRRLPLGGAVEPGARPGPGAGVRYFETTASGPVLPLGAVLGGIEPLRLRGTWRYGQVVSGATPALFPEEIVRGELFFHDEFFRGNLEVRMALGLQRRSAMLGPAGDGGLAPVPAYTVYDWNLLLRIDTVRIWWRVENLSGVDAEDLPGLPFPPVRNAFGVRWEFFN